MRRAFLIGAALLSGAAQAQVRTVDPNQAGAMARTTPATAAAAEDYAEPADDPVQSAPAAAAPPSATMAQPQGTTTPPPASQAEIQARQAVEGGTYQEGDVLAAAEGVFGKGAAGLAQLIEKIFKDQGRPNAYIAGREAGGAFVVGLRYGSGTMFHKVEGQRPVYWTGPSVGFDVGANGAKTFVLVYNLYDAQELFHRYPAAEGNVYIVGGLTASYLRRGDKVLIPIRLGVGWRLGANLGYMRFTEKATWLPF
ncbi:DUF1134 domain-containing protein [uncultured Sphingomonas sp.]|uniref:DUF1134 domain-containing protein n=1 Tax=uncultured Sphingomonas sp. TaxID=158754 RepID=UPI0025FD2EF3|nr:DUF1134 domain-containing protein [uncultured Sphingomonas sp.]